MSGRVSPSRVVTTPAGLDAELLPPATFRERTLRVAAGEAGAAWLPADGGSTTRNVRTPSAWKPTGTCDN